MSEHLCLKWNNHSIAFLRSIKNIEVKEKYCDATIVCQGKYYPVHRFILSTCSEYFEEIFDRIQSPHPYIIFKDIEPREMELLLSYMYQGEVNVLQAILPTFIKAAEALKIKGLAVPDDIPSHKEERSRKRPSSSTDGTPSKRRGEEFSRRKDDNNINREPSSSESVRNLGSEMHKNEIIPIKEEPQDIDPQVVSTEFCSSFPVDETGLDDYSSNENSSYIKSEPTDNAELPIDDQSWSNDLGEDFNTMHNFGSTEANLQNDDISEMHLERQEPKTTKSFQMASNIDHASGTTLSPTLSRQMGTFKCTFCNYESYVKGNVRYHMMFKHTGERPFPCTFCPKRFVKKQHLDRHLVVHKRDQTFDGSIQENL